MAIDLLDHESVEVEADVTVHDIDELVRQIENVRAELRRSWLVASVQLVSAVVLLVVCGAVAAARVEPHWTGLLLPGVAVALVLFAVGYAIASGRERRHAVRALREYLSLLRQTTPAFVRQGRISELRWATIKIMLSRYGI